MDADQLVHVDFFVDRSGMQLFRHHGGTETGLAVSKISRNINSIDDALMAMAREQYLPGDGMQLLFMLCIKIAGIYISRRTASMPMFEFVCNDCESPFEDLVFGTELSGVLCPVCGSNQVKKKMSTFASKVEGSTTAFSMDASSAAACGSGSV